MSYRPEVRPSRDPDVLIGFLARVGWEVCPSCDGRGGTATRDDVFPCGDCGGFCLVEIEDEPDYSSEFRAESGGSGASGETR
jgi:hypothetical protein